MLLRKDDERTPYPWRESQEENTGKRNQILVKLIMKRIIAPTTSFALTLAVIFLIMVDKNKNWIVGNTEPLCSQRYTALLRRTVMNINNGEKQRILLVDDEPDALWVLRNLLKQNGCEIVIAQSGQEALQHAEYFIPDLILLDVDMPGMDGFETCRR